MSKDKNALSAYLKIKDKKVGNTSEPFITVGIFTYNRAEYLSEAIKSVLGQTYKNFELIIADDGSTDNTEEVINSYDSEKITYIKKDHSNAADTRNYALRAANGDYILWMGDDDLLSDDALKTGVEYINNYPDADIFYPKLLGFDNLTGETSEINYNEWYNKPEEMLRYTIIIGQPIPDGGTFVNKKIYDELGEFNPDCKRGFDFEFLSRVIQTKRFNAKYIDKILYKYRRHSTNITYKKLKPEDLITERLILNRFLTENRPEDIFPDLDWQNNRNQASLIANCQMAIKYFQYLGKDEGAAYLTEAIRFNHSIDGLITIVELLLGAKLAQVADLFTDQFVSVLFLDEVEMRKINLIKSEIKKHL